MTVPAAATTYRYQGNGVTTIFAYSNRLLTEDDVKVQILTRATDAVVETLTLTTDYTVTIVSNSLANITITNATKIPSVTQDILLTLNLAISQTRSYPRADSLPAADIERGLDKLTLIAQKLDDGQTLTLRFPESDTTSDGELPSAANRASKYLAFDADGEPTVTAGTDTITSAFGLTLVQADDAAEARTLLELQSVPYTAASASGAASLQFAEDTDNGTNKITLSAPASLTADRAVNFIDAAGDVVITTATQTLTNKSLTDPLISAQGGALILPQSLAPLPTTDGDIRWDSDDNRLVVGDGVGQQIFYSGLGFNFKVGQSTRDLTTATGTQTITGVGFTPRLVIVSGTVQSTAKTQYIGWSDGTTQWSLLDSDLASTETNEFNTSAFFVYGAAGANYQAGNITTFNSDGFVISWVKTGSPTGTFTFQYIAIA